MIRTVCAAILVLLAADARAGVFTGDWLELIDTTKLPLLRDDVALQVSSYDRTGGNDDGFSGQYSFLRQEGDGFVIFEDQGPGCVYRIWSANPGKRRIEFYFDGEAQPRLVFDHWEDMFLGKVEPFMPPVSVHEIGGWTSYVPLPYEKSLKIVTRERVNFYQVTYHKFADGSNVKTFTPGLDDVSRSKYERVRAAWARLGEHPWPEAIERSESFSKRLPAAGGAGSRAVTVARLSGSGVVHSLKLEFDAAAFTPRMLRQIVLRVTSGKGPAQVEVPLGDFYLQGFPDSDTRSLLAGVQAGKPYAFYSYWPMPYEHGMRVELLNESKAEIAVNVEVGFAKQSKNAGDAGLFHAKWLRQNPTTAGELFPILDARGRGHWCGVSVAMQGDGPGMGYLEGDELLWIDDRDHTSWNGTGSEDYYNGGWYFGRTGSFPYFGCGYHNDPEGRVHAFRLHMTDIVPFQRQARIGIEHGHGNEVQADYAGVTFWYAAANTEAVRPPMLEARERMWRPLSLPGVIEAEAAIVADVSAGSIVDDYESETVFSGGRAVQANAAPDIVVLDVEVRDDDIYELNLRGAGGRTHVRVDGGALMQTEVLFRPVSEGPGEVSVGELRLSPGKHRVEIASWFTPMVIDAYRLKPSMKTPGAIEAERAIAGSNGCETVRVDLTQRRASGDSFVKIKGPKGSSASFAWEAAWNTRYVVSVRLQRSPASGVIQFLLDGAPFGQPIPCFERRPEWVQPIDIGTTGRLSAGPHTLSFTIVDTPASGEAELDIDYFFIVPDGVYEGESLKTVHAQGDTPHVQDMKGFGSQWSSGAQMWFTPQSERAEAVFEIDVPRAEERTVCAYFTQAPDYGIYQVTIDGRPIGEAFDGYAPGVVRSERVCFGKYAFTKGKHRIAFTCSGKNAKSSSYMLGIDQIVLE